MPRRRKRNDGKRYEAKVSGIVRKLYPYAVIRDNVKLPSTITPGRRQVDTLVTTNAHLIDFDAKDHKRNIGIDDVAAYDFKLKDENVPMGVMVSNSPYAESAVAAATHLGIRPMHLIDTTDKENPFSIASHTLIKVRYIKSLSFGVRHMSMGGDFNVFRDLGKQELISDNEEDVATSYEVFGELWNSGHLLEEIKKTNGDVNRMYRYTLSNQKIIMADGTRGVVDEFTFDYEIATEYLEGKWNVKEAQGLYDAAKKTFLTNQSIESEILSIEEMKKWPTVDANKIDEGEYGVQIEVVSELPEAPS